ncbi:hypothetical protein ACAG26_24185 [Mycobacterium sp. pUA109]|uniref:DUF7666 domain-containing protein n=1 Tax=Mycobacterium sp. pUA109 TaxID=3238982 RepID=UPI00351BE081
MSVTVRNQAQLDQALADEADVIYIKSPAAVWLTVTATGSSSVTAWGSSSVVAWDSSSVVATKYVVVHLWSQRVTLTGDGHLIDMTGIDLDDPVQWCEYHGVAVEDGIAHVYKAVAGDWKSGYGTDYSPGSTPEAPDWSTERACGGGLHFCAAPSLALTYLNSPRHEARFLRCGMRLDEMVCLGDKIKAKRVVVGCVEVDRHGDVVGAVTA